MDHNKCESVSEMCMVSDVLVCESAGDWYIDSGASTHVCCECNMFVSLDPTTAQVRGVSRTVPAQEQGVMHLHVHVTNENITLILQNVLFIPQAGKNLLSTSALKCNGKHMTFKNGVVRVYNNNNKLIATGTCSANNLYAIDLQWHMPTAPTDTVCLTDTNLSIFNSDNLAHCRLGHINNHHLTTMSNGLANGITFKNPTNPQPCVACTFGKQHCSNISTTPRTHASNALDLIHTDVCRPMPTPSIDSNKYFVTFIDDSTNSCVISFIKQKSQVLEKFQNFVKMMENQIGKCAHTVCCDQGGEYTSHNWKKFCASKGITMEYTAPHMPEHNGVAERRNLMLANSARCMMTHSGVGAQLILG